MAFPLRPFFAGFGFPEPLFVEVEVVVVTLVDDDESGEVTVVLSVEVVTTVAESTFFSSSLQLT